MRDRSATGVLQFPQRHGGMLWCGDPRFHPVFVDLMDRPRLAGDRPAVVQVLDAIGPLDLDRVVHYAGCLGNATTAGIAGWYLERSQQRLGVTPAVLCRLERLRPRGPHYLSRSQRVHGRYLARWNLVVPPSL